MARKKVKLAFIVNDSKRKATFMKRRKGMLKKMSEITTLCGIDACGLIYSPYTNQPDVWPSPEEFERVYTRYRSMPEMEQTRKMLDIETFMRQRRTKAYDQLKKQVQENRETDVSMLMNQCLAGRGVEGLMMTNLNDLEWMINENLKGINKMIEKLKMQEGGTSEAAPENVAVPVVQAEPQGMEFAADGDMQMPEWFCDEQIGFDGGNETLIQFDDSNNPGNIWNGDVFP